MKDKKPSPKPPRDNRPPEPPHGSGIFKKVIVIFIAVILLLIAVYLVLYKINEMSGESVPVSGMLDSPGVVTTISEGDIREILDISELSTIDYTYNSIVKVYADDEKTKPAYSVYYSGKISAGIDFSKLEINVDDEAKTITVMLPQAEIQDTYVDVGSLEYIFDDEKYETETVSSDAYKYALEDLEEKAFAAETNSDILKLAEENAKSAAEALLEPWIDQIGAEDSNMNYSISIGVEGEQE